LVWVVYETFVMLVEAESPVVIGIVAYNLNAW
jgi:hypothetical protein